MEVYSSIRKKASLVLKVIDGFTGLAIKNANISINNAVETFINKKDGFYVLLNAGEMEYKIKICFLGYFEKEVEIKADGKVSIIEMLPYNYHDSILILGEIKTNANRKLSYFIESKKEYRVVKNYIHQSKELLITKGKTPSEGQYVVFGNSIETINIEKVEDAGDYYKLYMEEDLKSNYKVGDLVIKSYKMDTEDNGKFELIMPSKEGTIFVLDFEDGRNDIYFYLSKKKEKKINIGKLTKKNQFSFKNELEEEEKEDME